MKVSARTIAFTALLAAIVCVLAPWTVPVGPVPISLATLGVYLACCVIDCKHGVVATLAYVLLGAIGIDLFGREKRVWVYPLAMIAGTVALYAFGTVWFMISTGSSSLGAALLTCVVPFLAGDGIKIAAATAVGYPVRRAVKKTIFTGGSR